MTTEIIPANSFSQGEPLPPASLIIASRNRPQLLLETVESVLKGIELPTEIIIVDQSDERHPTLSDMQDPRCEIRYVWTRCRGASRGRNEGILAAQNDIVVLIDDDVHVAPEWYGALVRGLCAGGRRCVVTGRILPGTASPGGFTPAVVTSEVPKTYTGRIGTDVLVTCNMAMYRSAFSEVGVFDERLGPGTRLDDAEDNDYGFRLLEAGYRIAYLPEALVYHRAWRSKKDYFPMRWSYGRGKGGFYSKYWSLRDSYILRRMLWDIALRLIRFPWRVLHKPNLAFGDLVYVAGMLSGTLEWVMGTGTQPSARATLSDAHKTNES